MAFEMGKHDHGIVIQQVLAHGDLFKLFASGDGQGHVAVLVHDVYRGEGRPAVLFKRPAVAFRGLAQAAVEDVAFHHVGVGNRSQKGFDPFAGQDVGAAGFAGMQLDGDFPGDVPVDHAVEPE